MHGSLKVVQGIVLLSFVGLMFSSCGGSQTSLSSSDSTSGTTTVDPTPATSEGESIEEEEKNATIPSGYSASNLFVTVPDTEDYTTFTTITGAPAQRCSFTSSSVVNDITCNVEIGELALFFNGIKFQYNVPANACKYISTYPYWFYNYEVSTGPQSVSMTITKSASGVVTSSFCQVTNNGVSSSVVACGNSLSNPDFNDVTFDLSGEGSAICNSDTSNEDGGRNCCFGKYDLTKKVINDGVETNTFERGKSWGGSASLCIGGPGMTSWEEFDRDGLPVPVLEKMTTNVARTKIYKVKSVAKSVNGAPSNYVVANHFTLGAHNHTGYHSSSGTASVLPYFVDPVSDRNGSYVPPGNPYYLFDCLDEAFETNFRIRMVVQEWDTMDALQTYISTGVSAVGPDENGTAPANCPGISGDSCNTAWDSDDFILRNGEIPGQTYNITDPEQRKYYFPRDTY